MYNIVVLYSGMLYTLSKFSNSSFNLIVRNAVQVMIILYSQFYNPSCNLFGNKNKHLYCFPYIFLILKFVKIFILLNFFNHKKSKYFILIKYNTINFIWKCIHSAYI